MIKVWWEDMQRRIRRGDIYWAKIPYVQNLNIVVCRPAIIVSNDIGNERSDNVIVVPVTTQKKHLDLPTNVPIGDNITRESSVAVCEQIRVLCKDNLGDYIGHLDRKRMNKVTEAMKVAVGILEEK